MPGKQHSKKQKTRMAKAAFQKTEDTINDCAKIIERQETRKSRLEKRLAKIENTWLENHDCSCDLLEIPCTH